MILILEIVGIPRTFFPVNHGNIWNNDGTMMENLLPVNFLPEYPLIIQCVFGNPYLRCKSKKSFEFTSCSFTFS